MIQVRGLSKRFGDKPVLQGIDLTLAKGESLVVIGGSGTGKSVLLRCILGLERPDAGQILWQGQPLADNRAAFMAGFGMLFQNAALFDSLPVWRNVAFRLLRTMPRARARQIAVEKLARVGLDPEVAELYPAALSGGMRKRAGLARAIAADPKVIFFDEPTTGLDPIRADVINDLIVSLVRDLGVTALTITHDMASARKIAHRVAMLYNGKIIWDGPRDLIHSSGNPYVDQFVNGRAEGPIKTGVLNR